jgi:rare lipoprotein A
MGAVNRKLTLTMLFFGFFFAASWIGSILSLGEIPANVMPKLSSGKVSSHIGRLAIKSRLMVFTKQSASTLNATILPSRFFNIDWGTKESTTKTQTKPQISHQLSSIETSNNRLCSAAAGTFVEKQPLNNIGILQRAKIIEAGISDQDFLPNRILRSLRSGLPPTLQSFFRLPNFPGLRSHPVTFPVAVIQRHESNYEVWVNNRQIAHLPSQTQADAMQMRLTKLLKSPNLDASQLKPGLVDGVPSLMTGNRFLFGINKEISQETTRSSDVLAIEWVNNLRMALQKPVLSLVEGQLEMYGLTSSNQKLSGLASWYGGYFHGRTTANGETYNQNELTVAHKSLPFNTYLQVTNLNTGKPVIVRVNDRGPFIPPRSLDLSREASRCINSETAGVVPYEAVILQPNQPKMTLNAAIAIKNQVKNQKSARKLAVVSEF